MYFEFPLVSNLLDLLQLVSRPDLAPECSIFNKNQLCVRKGDTICFLSDPAPDYLQPDIRC